jgi:hypothetical protein
MWLNNEATPSVVSADGTWTAPYTYANLAPNATNTGTYFEYTLPASKLVAGQNILAVQVSQSSVSSSDLLVDGELIGDPVLPLGVELRLFRRQTVALVVRPVSNDSSTRPTC